jgi:dipeptidase
MKRLFKQVLALVMAVAVLSAGSSALACTGVYVGKEASEDGSIIIARSNDCHPGASLERFEVVERVENEPGRTYDGDNGFSYPLPDTTYKYTAIPFSTSQQYGIDAAGTTNEYGLAVSATVTAYICEAAAEADPSVADGIGEESIAGLLAATCQTAREATELLCSILDEYGTCEQNIIMIADQEEAWYIETYTGHQYAAVKMPEDCVAVFGNEFMLETVDPDDPDTICSAELFTLPEEEGFAVYDEDGTMNLFNTYAGEGRLADYANRRTWIGHELLAPSTAGEYNTTTKYPLFYQPDELVSVKDVMEIFRNRFEGTEYSPDETGRTDIRVIATETQAHVHIIQLFDTLPQEMSCVTWLTLSNAEFAPFIPISSLVSGATEAYTKDQDVYAYDEDAAYCVFKSLNTLCAQDRTVYGAGVRAYWSYVEDQLVEELPSVLEETAALYAQSPEAAQAYITDYCNDLQTKAVADASRLYTDVLWYMMNKTDTLQHSFSYSTLTMAEEENVIAPFVADFDVALFTENLGWTATLDGDVMTLVRDGDTITITAGGPGQFETGSMDVNGETVEADATLSNGSMYLPFDLLTYFE